MFERLGKDLLCVFVNMNSFQSCGSYVTIQSIVKRVMPSISKRFVDVNQNDEAMCNYTQPPGSIFDYEINRAIQQRILKTLRQIVLSDSNGVGAQVNALLQ